MSDVQILTTEDLGQGRCLIKAKGPLAFWTMERSGDDDPVFPSVPLALVLGYARINVMNRLILRLYPTEKYFRTTMVQKSPGDGEVFYRLLPSTGGRPGKEYLLTRRQALKVIMRSETPRADALQRPRDPLAQAQRPLRRRGGRRR